MPLPAKQYPHSAPAPACPCLPLPAPACDCFQGLSLASQCLSYDFVGTLLDDSAEEICTIQV